MFAIIKTGGKEYKVDLGESLHIEKLDSALGEDVVFEEVLLVNNEGEVQIGTPTLEGVSVAAKIVTHYRGEKIIIFKHKRRKNYRRKTGHRQDLTEVVITRIGDVTLEDVIKEELPKAANA